MGVISTFPVFAFAALVVAFHHLRVKTEWALSVFVGDCQFSDTRIVKNNLMIRLVIDQALNSVPSCVIHLTELTPHITHLLTQYLHHCSCSWALLLRNDIRILDGSKQRSNVTIASDQCREYGYSSRQKTSNDLRINAIYVNNKFR